MDMWEERGHVKQTWKKPFKCTSCGKNYLHQRSLWRHKNQECGQEPRFQCPYCPLRSKHKFNIDSHIKYKHGLSMWSMKQLFLLLLYYFLPGICEEFMHLHTNKVML